MEGLDLMGAEEMADPAVIARKLHAGSACRLYTRFDPPFYILSRYDDVSAVLRDPGTFVSGQGQGPNFAQASGLISDPPTHTWFRELVQPSFMPRAIAALQPRLEAIGEDLLDAVADRPTWDVHDEVAFPLPVTIICEIFGIPTQDIGQFKRWSDSSVAALSAQDPTPYIADSLAMRDYVLRLLRDKRAHEPDDTLLARIAHARKDGTLLADDEAVGLVLQLFVAGNETTTSLITSFVWRFLAIDGLWSALCAGRIDLDRAIQRKLTTNEEKYPVKKAKGSARKYNAKS